MRDNKDIFDKEFLTYNAAKLWLDEYFYTNNLDVMKEWPYYWIKYERIT